jgi:hypothetical protein
VVYSGVGTGASCVRIGRIDATRDGRSARGPARDRDAEAARLRQGWPGLTDQRGSLAGSAASRRVRARSRPWAAPLSANSD